jgi:hypothetical protein
MDLLKFAALAVYGVLSFSHVSVALGAAAVEFALGDPVNPYSTK